jgi:hypothetical protein
LEKTDNLSKNLEIISSVLFFFAIVHTFLVSKIEQFADQKTKGSISAKILHTLSEVEMVFGLWAIIFLIVFLFIQGLNPVQIYVSSLNFNEPLFVFVIMCIAATRPVVLLATNIIKAFAKLLPFNELKSFYLSALIIGPLLGSLITEPATMTVTALILLESFYKEQVSLKFKYSTLALLFVNVSIGGTLTHFAAPPVLMVAAKWNWGSLYMLKHFGLKALVAIIISTALFAQINKSELVGKLKTTSKNSEYLVPRWWKVLVHVLFLFSVVYFSHQPNIFVVIFCLFLIFVKLTKKYQDPIHFKTSFLVAFFLAGLVTLGSMQSWWLRPLLGQMNELTMFFGATALTAITDNAALTYLGSLVDLSDAAKYALVSGAVAGGGLTVIANAPNPAGFGILRDSFGEEGINPLRLFIYALIPTIVAVVCFLYIPNIIF